MSTKPIRVVVNDMMQRRDDYYRAEPIGKNFIRASGRNLR
jgi:hypothetical protein